MWSGVEKAVRGLCRWVLVGAACAGALGQANGYTLTVTPPDQTTTVGSQVGVAVTASDLLAGGIGIGAYNLDLSFGDDVLSFNNVVDGFGLGAAFGLTYALSGNMLTLTDTSLDDPDTLLALQSPSFTLFTVYFDAIGAGTSLLSLSGITLADAYGALAVGVSSVNGSVTAMPASPVPEPGAIGMMLLGMAWLWFQRRKFAGRG